MRKILAALTVVVLAAGSAMAAGHMGGGPGMGCGCGSAKGMSAQDSAAHKKFLSDTMSLRQELMNKQFEMQKEYVKETPDQAVMTKLKGEISELSTKLKDARVKAGLPVGPKGHKGQKGHHKMQGGMGGGMMDCPMMSDPAAPAAPAPAAPASK
jgi:hypothetical protein